MATKSLLDRFIEDRTRSLASVYLTRRDDLLVVEAPRGAGVDLHAIIRTGQGRPERRFGIVLEGRKADLTAARANASVQSTLDMLGRREFAYPVALFLFRMENDRGFFTWVVEPLITEQGPLLYPHATASFADLDTNAVNQIVAAVNAWYDAGRPSGIELLHSIIDAARTYFAVHGQPAAGLRLPFDEAYELAKLGRDQLGPLSGEIIKTGVKAFEEQGLLGLKVRLVADQEHFSLE
jgi:hypothetical protein